LGTLLSLAHATCSSVPLSPVRFFLTAPPPTEIYTLSLHDALPISVYCSSPVPTLTSSTVTLGWASSKSAATCSNVGSQDHTVSSPPSSRAASTSEAVRLVAPASSSELQALRVRPRAHATASPCVSPVCRPGLV